MREYQKTIEALSENYWGTIRKLLRNYQKTIEELSENYWGIIRKLLRNYQKTIEELSENYWGTIRKLLRNYQKNQRMVNLQVSSHKKYKLMRSNVSAKLWSVTFETVITKALVQVVAFAFEIHFPEQQLGRQHDVPKDRFLHLNFVLPCIKV